MKSIALLSALVLTCVATAAGAESGTKEEQAACRPDVRKLCSSLGKADEDAYRACLQFHFGELSPKCAQVMTVHQTH
jgi:hypothetical protein